MLINDTNTTNFEGQNIFDLSVSYVNELITRYTKMLDLL